MRLFLQANLRQDIDERGGAERKGDRQCEFQSITTVLLDPDQHCDRRHPRERVHGGAEKHQRLTSRVGGARETTD
jgi:hypothetical protein